MEIPKKLGKYKIQRALGRGAMGVVYEGFDPLIERSVAIKTILKSAIDKENAEESFNRFRREARAAGRLTHPNIVSIYEYGEDGDIAFIVMELVRGKELKELFDHHDRFSLKNGLSLVRQILEALDYSHSQGIVHRDIKPANIMITPHGQAKIADFGIAKIDSSMHTQVGLIMGTPTYMAPEQLEGLDVDRRADLYSAGVILYQVLTGRRPFSGSMISVMHQVLNQEAPPPSSLNPDISTQLDEVVRKAMAKRPDERFQTAAEFLSALKAAELSLASPEAISRQTDAGDFEASAADRTIKLFDTVQLDASGQEKTLTLVSNELRTQAFPKTTPDATVTLIDHPQDDEARKKIDIDAWKAISNSQAAEDFHRYLENFPNGEFADLARVRLESLRKAAEQARLEASRKQQELEIKRRAALEEKARQEMALRAEAAKARRQAELEARRLEEEKRKQLLAHKVAEIRMESEAAWASAAAQRAEEDEKRAQHAREMSDALSQQAHKFVEVFAKREAIADAERKLKTEHKKSLREKIREKNQERQASLMSGADLKTPQQATPENGSPHEKKPDEREQASQESILQEEAKLAEREAARQKALAERKKREAEAQMAKERMRKRYMLFAVATLLVLLLVGYLGIARP